MLVVATESTISGGAYQSALTSLAPRVRVFGRACPLWVTLAEQGPQSKAFVASVLLHALRGYDSSGPNTLLLGCTHFPVFKSMLEELLPDTRVVDSAATTSQVVLQRMRELELLGANEQGRASFLATDGQARFMRVGRHFLGEPIERVELIDL